MSSDDRQLGGSRRPGPVVRPYAITGGRASPRNADLEIEALVSSTVLGETTPGLRFEYISILRLCTYIRSIAEVSALLEMPLGVTRVLVADMAADGLVQLHRPVPTEVQSDLPLLKRVLHGLHQL